MSFEQYCTGIFAGHQTFHPRFGWLKKGVDAVSQNSKVFSSPDATTILGVGKNMVESIKFWCLSFKLIEADDDGYKLSDFSRKFLENGGWDPFVEDTSTLWLLHLRLLEQTCLVPSWWIFFNNFSAATFSQKSVQDFVFSEIFESTLSKKPIRGSVDKDVDAILRMYSSRKLTGRQTLEDLLDSPFRDLGVFIKNEVGEFQYRFVFGEKSSLTPFVVLYACLKFLLNETDSNSSISISRLVNEENSPGKLLKLDSNSLVGYLESIPTEGVRVTNSAGFLQLVVSGRVQDILESLSHDYYMRPTE